MTEKHGTVCALGSFDGFHTGHLAVIDKAKQIAADISAFPAVVSFDEHPLSVLRGKAPAVILEPCSRDEFVKKLKVQDLKLDFDEIKDLSPESFVDDILIKRFGARGVCCGYNYRFGKDAAGTSEMLMKLCAQRGLECSVAGAALFKGMPVSSTRIRKALADGCIEDADAMLGRAYRYKLTVVPGDKRGRLIGSPTINQVFPAGVVIPKFGVYASKTKIKDVKYISVTNIGLRPTVDGHKINSETYILNYSGDLYGKDIEVRLYSYMRQERKFASLDDLKQQIHKDALQAQKILDK